MRGDKRDPTHAVAAAAVGTGRAEADTVKHLGKASQWGEADDDAGAAVSADPRRHRRDVMPPYTASLDRRCENINQAFCHGRGGSGGKRGFLNFRSVWPRNPLVD